MAARLASPLALLALLLLPSFVPGDAGALAYPPPGLLGAHVHSRWMVPGAPLDTPRLVALLEEAGAQIVPIGVYVANEGDYANAARRLDAWLDATPAWRSIPEVDTFEMAPSRQTAAGMRDLFAAFQPTLAAHPSVLLVAGGNEPVSAARQWPDAAAAEARVRTEYAAWHAVSDVPFCHKFTNPAINTRGVDWAMLERLWAEAQDAVCYDWYASNTDTLATLDRLRAVGARLGKPVHVLEAAVPNDDPVFLARMNEGLASLSLYHLVGEAGKYEERLALWVLRNGVLEPQGSADLLREVLEPLPAPPGWRVATRFTDATAAPAVPFRAFNPASLQWTDMDRDGRPELLATNTNRQVYLFDPAGSLRAEVAWPAGAGYDPSAALQPSLVAGDVDGDGRRELYVAGDAGRIRKYEFDPALTTEDRIGLRFDWERCVQECQGRLVGTPVGAAARLFVSHDGGPGHAALYPDGRVAWRNASTEGIAGVASADLDGDGKREVVFGTDDGRVVVRRPDGSHVWTYDLRIKLGVRPGTVQMQPLLADLEGDGRLEVIVSGLVAEHADVRQDHARYIVLESNGKLRWFKASPRGDPGHAAQPALVDVNGDGVRDVVVLDWNTRGPSTDYQRLAQSRLMAFHGRNGSLLWDVGIASRWSDQAPVVADADGDGRQEILVPQQHHGRDGLSVFDLQGNEEWWWPAPEGWTVARGALAVSWQGRLHLAVSLAQPEVESGVRSPAGTSSTGQLLLLDTSHPWRSAWSGQAWNAS